MSFGTTNLRKIYVRWGGHVRGRRSRRRLLLGPVGFRPRFFAAAAHDDRARP